MATKKMAKNSPWSTARDRAAEREEKMEALLHTAARAFSENGYHRTSLDDIAERLGITKPTLYYYVDSKEDLYLEGFLVKGLDQIIEASFSRA